LADLLQTASLAVRRYRKPIDGCSNQAASARQCLRAATLSRGPDVILTDLNEEFYTTIERTIGQLIGAHGSASYLDVMLPFTG
jgi:hypothetical protein